VLQGAVSVALVAAAVGCSKGSAPAGTGGRPDSSRTPDPDPALLAVARSAEQDLIAQYDAVIAAEPTLAGQLTALRADHLAHLSALGGTPTTPSAQPSIPPPGTAAQALAALAGAERTAAAARVAQCRAAREPALARLIASIGGSEAAHDAVLTDLAAAPT